MLSCKEVTRIVASDELAGAGWRRRLAIRIHLLICRYCRRYAAQLRAIGQSARKLFRLEKGGPETIHRLKQAILQRSLEGPKGSTEQSSKFEFPSENPPKPDPQ